MVILKVLASVVLCAVLSYGLIVRLRELYRQESKDNDWLVLETVGAMLVGLLCAALFGALLKFDLSTTVKVAVLITVALWFSAFYIWLHMGGKTKIYRPKIYRALNESFRLVRMFGMAGILATAMLPLCRLAA